MDGASAFQLPLPWAAALALLAAGGGLGSWSMLAAHGAVDPAVRSAITGGALFSGQTILSSAAALSVPSLPSLQLPSWAFAAAGAGAATLLRASAAVACACGAGGIVAVWVWQPRQAPAAAATAADFFELATQIRYGGWRGPAHQAAARRLHTDPEIILHWAQSQAQRMP